MSWLQAAWQWLINARLPLADLEFPVPVFNWGGIPGQITKSFHIDEFKTRDGTPVPEEYYGNVELLAEQLQVLRDEIKKPIKVISGYRHPAYNKKVGGAKKSQHLTASAADITVKGMSARRVADKISDLIKEGKVKKGGLGRYPGFTHYDIRPRNSRWGSNTRKKK